MQVLILVAVVAVLGYAVVKVSGNWADWVVFGVLVLTVVGAARAVFVRRYPTRKRTFVRDSGPDRRR